MAADVGALLQEALALPERDRANIAAELLASLDGPGSDCTPEMADAYAREIERRMSRVVRGESAGVDL